MKASDLGDGGWGRAWLFSLRVLAPGLIVTAAVGGLVGEYAFSGWIPMAQATGSNKSRLRSLLKAISYRVLGSLVTGVFAWAVTGDAQVAFTIGALESTVKMATYYVHERVWLQVPDRLLGRQ